MRIVSLSPSTTEILFAIGAGDQVVGVTTFCDYPLEAKNRPNVGGWSTADLEKVFDLEPDLVLTSTIVQHRAVKLFANSPFDHRHLDPRSLSDILNNITSIGQLIGHEAQANELVERLQLAADAMSEIVNQTSNRPRVYCEEWPHPAMISGNWVPELVQLAGGEYGIINPGQISRTVESAEVIKFNPEIIILNYCGFGSRSKPATIQQRSDWQPITAVQNQAIAVIDDSLLNRPGPRVIVGLTELVKLLHPNLAGAE